MTGDIVVQLAGGRYELRETLVIGPEHSGREQWQVTFQATDAAHPPIFVAVSTAARVAGFPANRISKPPITALITVGNYGSMAFGHSGQRIQIPQLGYS